MIVTPSRLKPLLLLLTVGGLIGGTVVLARIATGAGMGPFALAFWQAAGAAAVLIGVGLRHGERPPMDRRHIRYYGFSAVTAIALPNTLLFTVVPHLGTGLATLAIALSPLLTYGLAVGLKLDRLQPHRAAGLILGLIGTALILVPRISLSDPGSAAWLGLALLVPASLAGGNIYRTRAWPPGAAPGALAGGMLAAAALLLAPFGFAGGLEAALPPLGALPAVIGMMVLTGASYRLFFTLQRIAGPVYLSQIGYVITAVGMVLGMVLFGERQSLWVWLATILIAGGIALVNRPANAPPPHPAPQAA